MRQAVMSEPKKIEFRDVPVPQVQEGEVLVKIQRIGVCGSDIHVYHGLHPYTSYPVVQGHEVSGVVAETGPGASSFRTGDKVTIEPQVSCGVCYACSKGMYNICDKLMVLGFQTTGAASDYFAVKESRLVRLPQSMDPGNGAMIEPLSVAVRAVKRAGNVKDGKILVLGAGPIGNLVAQTAKAAGAKLVMIADVNDFRLAKARDCDVDLTVNPKSEKIKIAVEKHFGVGEKADMIFECAGAVPTMDAAVDIARKGSTIVVVGVFGEKIAMDMAKVNENELTLVGTARYVIEDFRTAIKLVEEGKVKLKPLITHEFPFDMYLEAYELIEHHGGEAMKVLIKVNE